ncbi:MAG: hypothetical protein AAGF12_41990 [Myxococcota bacterium]
MKRKLGYVAAGFVGLLVIGGVAFAVTGGPLADLRPSSVTVGSQPDREERGRTLLQSAWEAAGGERTLARSSARFELRDHWVGTATLFNPWPDDDQRVRFEIETHTFNSTATLLNGESANVTWGIENGEGWTEAGGERTASDDPNLRFMLPTVHYFIELSQRLTEAPVVRWVDERTIDGRGYDVVFATWTSVEAHDGEDQYLVFIDQHTGRIGKVQYTVREIARFATGTCHLDDQREVDGVWIPHVMTVTAEPTDPVDEYMHRMTISDFEWSES